MAEASAGARAVNGSSNVRILQGIQRDVHAADEVTNKAAEQLDHQTEQIRSIDKDVDSISSTMDHAAEIIKGMNPLGMLQQAISGYTGSSDRAECKWMWKDTKVPSLFGDLSKRDPLRWSQYQGLEDTIRDIDGYKEDRRILCKVRLPGRDKDEIQFDNPIDAVEKLRGILVLQQQAALAGVGSSSSSAAAAPGAAAVPYAPPRAAPGPSAARRLLPGQEEEALLADIGATLDGMHEKTQQMNRTLDVQNQMLPAVAEKMERERGRAEEQTKKLQKMQGR